MRHSIRYIFALACAVAFSACSKENFEGIGQNEDIEFIMRPTTFNAVDVARPQTKAEISEVEMLAAETAIHSLYFLVFDADGTRIVCKSALTNGLPTTQNLKSAEYFKKFPLTICYIANVKESFAKSIEHISDLSTKTLDIEYSSFENTVGIPIIDKKNASDPSDDLLGFPMIGKITYPNTEVTGPQVIVPLERLFAKVTVKIKADFNDSNIEFNLDPPSIEVNSYTLHNLPNKVCLGNAISEDGAVINESSWVDDDDAFEAPSTGVIDMIITDEAINIGGILNIDPTEIFTFYVPEYALEPSEPNTEQDQRIKPTLYDTDKFPVHLTLSGTAKQDNMVDLPVTYHIHFGENPYDSFSLRRNTWYTNNMIVKGTFEAILGEDQRVETDYYNIADPDNTGDNPANCYIVSKPGKYKLPTYIGNSTSFTSRGTSVELVTINGTNSIREIKFDTEEDGKNYIKFDVNLHDANGNPSLADVTGGNHLLILKDGNSVVWSWHLWMCAENNRPDKDGYMHIYPGTDAVVMNRALGATTHFGFEYDIPLIGQISLTQWTDGLYYQWGRKDPLSQQTASTGGTYEASIGNPRKFYSDWSAEGAGWSSTQKTPNDPCPPGFRVPSNAIWRAAESTSTGMEDIMEWLMGYIDGFDGYPYNLSVGTDMQVNIVYPYSSYLEASTGQKKSESNEEAHIELATEVTGQNLLGTTRYRSKDFYLSYTKHPAALWSADMDVALNYSKKTSRQSVRFVTGETQSYKLFSGWSNWSDYSGKTVSGNTVTDAFYNADPNASEYNRNYTGLSVADGLYVRCVSEVSPVK